MLFGWNENTIRWHMEASEYTGYHRKLTDLLLKYIPRQIDLCDMGCGIALADFLMAPEMRSITCVDIDANALRFVDRHTRELGLDNVRTIRSDGREADGQWDTVLAMYHGSIEKVGYNYLRKARNNLVLVTHGELVGSTGPEKYREKKPVNTDTTKAWLDAQGWKYTLETGALEFGQPHRSMEDAIACTAAYCPTAPIGELPAYVEKSVVATGNSEFPYYTPKVRRFGLFNIPRSNLD